MDYEQMEIDITLESDRDLKENMQSTAKFALGQIMEYQHPTKVKNRHEGYGIAAEGYASLQGKMKSTKTDMDDLLKLLPNGDGDVLNVIGSLYNSAVRKSFKEVMKDDVNNTFMNVDEFADMHTVDGKEIPVLVDDNEIIEREKKMKSNMDGVYVKQKLIYVKADDFGSLPAIGRQIVFDGKRYMVTDSTDEGGVYTITMEANRTK